jgi:hypothetical protein
MNQWQLDKQAGLYSDLAKFICKKGPGHQVANDAGLRLARANGTCWHGDKQVGLYPTWPSLFAKRVLATRLQLTLYSALHWHLVAGCAVINKKGCTLTWPVFIQKGPGHQVAIDAVLSLALASSSRLRGDKQERLHCNPSTNGRLFFNRGLIGPQNTQICLSLLRSMFACCNQGGWGWITASNAEGYRKITGAIFSHN